MGFSASPAEIQTFSQKMKDKHDAIDGMIRKSEGHATDVNNPSFQGAAGQAFQTSMSDYLTAARALNEALYTASDNVASVASSISESEIDNAQQILAGAETGDSVPQLNLNTK
ncbi:WXG100 family type VII secretion target [Nocardia asteroides]|uniref:WXG100 family type VII secretion target n=1 Tax=Nocardia asteroides TaxID=1824 RepID=UPI003410A5AE